VNTNQPSAGVASYVPVQGYSNGFGAGSAMGHWDESIFGSELMTPRLNAGANNLSSISVGLLNDLGYNVDYSGSLSGASSDPGRRFNISISFSGTEANRQTFESYFLEAASFWERYIYSGAFTNGDSSDLTIYASMFYSESLVLGSAGPTAGLTNTNRTAFQASEGVVNLNSYYYTPESLRDPTRSVAFTATIRHEIGHVLGIGTFWPNGSLYGVGEPTSTSSSTFADYAFIGANAVREYNALITDNTYSAPTSLLAPGESNTALTVASATEPLRTWFCASCGGLHLSEDARAHAAIPELTLVNALSEVVLGDQASQGSIEPPRNPQSVSPLDLVTGLEAGSHDSAESTDTAFITFSSPEPNPTADASSFGDGSQQLFIAEPVDPLGGLMPELKRSEVLTSLLPPRADTEPSINITQTSEGFIL